MAPKWILHEDPPTAYPPRALTGCAVIALWHRGWLGLGVSWSNAMFIDGRGSEISKKTYWGDHHIVQNDKERVNYSQIRESNSTKWRKTHILIHFKMMIYMQTFVTGLNTLRCMYDLIFLLTSFPSPISQRISAHIPVLVVCDAADRDCLRCLQSDRELASCPPAPAPYGMELFAQWHFPSVSEQTGSDDDSLPANPVH